MRAEIQDYFLHVSRCIRLCKKTGFVNNTAEEYKTIPEITRIYQTLEIENAYGEKICRTTCESRIF